MKYVLAIFLPPAAVLLCGKPGAALINLLLCLLLWVPGVIHAFIVIAESNADKRTDRIVKELQKQQK
jgi:uncharacterized membrane protein YqaE (UPF0057 family)